MKKLFVFGMLAAMIIFGACSKDKDDKNQDEGKATLTIRLVDAPAEYEAVNVEILSMKANLDDGWIDLPIATPGIYNLLDFTNGNSLLLIGGATVDPATMTELRLILGDENSVVVDGQTFELTTPSGQTSGYKVKMEPQVLAPGVTYNLVLDFDVSKSVHETGNGKYLLQPVVNGYLEGAIGGISGTIDPVDAAGYVEATDGTVTAGTYIDQTDGTFLIPAVPPGTYSVTFTANAGYQDKTVTGVIVVAGQVTEMGTIAIDPM